MWKHRLCILEKHSEGIMGKGSGRVLEKYTKMIILEDSGAALSRRIFGNHLVQFMGKHPGGMD